MTDLAELRAQIEDDKRDGWARTMMRPTVALALLAVAEAAREYLTGDPRAAGKARGDLHVAVAALEAALKETR